MQISKNNLLTIYHFFLRVMLLTSMECSIFNLSFQITIYTRVTTATMLFLQFNFVTILHWYFQKQDPRSCPGAALELPIQLKIEQFSPSILEFGLKDKVNHLNLNC